MQGSWPCIYIYIQGDGICSRHEMAVRQSLAARLSCDSPRMPSRHPQGALKDPWRYVEHRAAAVQAPYVKGDVGSLDGSCPVFYISPGILEGALRVP